MRSFFKFSHGIKNHDKAAVTDRGLEELFYFHARGVNINYEAKRNSERILSLSVDYMQIDNQIDGAFPRVNMQKLLSQRQDDKPCLSLNIITLPSSNKGMAPFNSS